MSAPIAEPKSHREEPSHSLAQFGAMRPRILPHSSSELDVLFGRETSRQALTIPTADSRKCCVR